MVVTTGDGYVGTADPQLREKLGELYATVAGNFTAPSASQMDNMESVKISFDEIMKEFKTLKTKNEVEYTKQATANAIPFVLKSFKDFVAE